MGKIHAIAKFTDLETAKDKKSKGAVSGEWQILGDNLVISEKVMDILGVTSVHTLLQNGVDIEIDRCIESDFVDEDTSLWNSNNLRKAFVIAEKCAVYQGWTVTVVVHLGNSFVHKHQIMADYIEGLLKEFTHCDIAIENTMLFNGYNKLSHAALCANTVGFVRGIRDKIGKPYKDRVGTVLDVCHALSTIRIQRRLFNDGTNEIDDLTDFFKSNQGICKVLHFNNCNELGIENWNHGTTFEDGDELFRSILDNYLKYIPVSDFVIEMQENDYSNSVNFERTVKQLQAMNNWD